MHSSSYAIFRKLSAWLAFSESWKEEIRQFDFAIKHRAGEKVSASEWLLHIKTKEQTTFGNTRAMDLD